MEKKGEIGLFYIKVASYWIRLQINHKKLSRYINDQYITDNLPLTEKPEGHIEVSIQAANLNYIVRSKTGRRKFHVSIPITSSVYHMEFMLQGLIEVCVLQKNIFFMHGSCFYAKEVINIFIGPSGAGKTTIIKLLKAQDRFSNDTVIIQYSQGSYQIHSSPFDKKSGIKMVQSKTVRHIHIFVLHQAKNNMISDMDLQHKMSSIIRNFTFFMFITRLDASSFRSISSLYKSAHKYMLLVLKYAVIRGLSFNRKLTFRIFDSLT